MILLDTHALLWRELEPERLSAKARSAIETATAAGEEVVIAAITLWEIVQLASRSRIHLLVPIADFLGEIEENYRTIPITGKIAAQASTLATPFPKDPMDRLIAAAALSTSSTLVTADRLIHMSKACNCLW